MDGIYVSIQYMAVVVRMYANFFFFIQVSVGDLLEESNIVLGNRSEASDVDEFYFPDVGATTEVDLGDDEYSKVDLEDEHRIEEALEDNDCFEGLFPPPNVSIHVPRSIHTYTSRPIHVQLCMYTYTCTHKHTVNHTKSIAVIFCFTIDPPILT